MRRNKISRDTTRRIGAVTGLVLGFVLMKTLGYSGVLPTAIFGATFCVVGAMAAERWYEARS
ncbi:hypothetical protein K227x_08670 [Rubripirellula lacrimiformis]|uniref:Uncharacterized protein n=1 Tax=Rubripirellula lacrimiformis TaxID=1930273 RepID=A0A517N5S5_9BACT|nr:hypothetical protein [Rubripirellula lacrimiformis]QDT02490.1 hypothetical protein K227x_08670 [Rubripirellula lacrimiformis]